MLVADYTGQSYSVIGVDANDYTGGFVVIYGTGQNAIEAAGYGVAVGNAVSMLKQAADDVCAPCSEGGVGEVLERIVRCADTD